MKHLYLVWLILILSSCGTPELSTPAATPEAINIIYPPALQPWAGLLSTCASNNPQSALYFMQADTVETDIPPNQVVLELGHLDDNSDGIFRSQVGWEQIVVIVNKDNALSQLSNDELRSIFSSQSSSLETGFSQPIQVWVLPEGDPTRVIFDQVVMQKLSSTTQAMLAPEPGAMLDAISQNVDAIGYLPGSFLTIGDSYFADKVKIIQLETLLNEQLRQPVIAITKAEPEGLLRSLLVCLESQTP